MVWCDVLAESSGAASVYRWKVTWPFTKWARERVNEITGRLHSLLTFVLRVCLFNWLGIMRSTGRVWLRGVKERARAKEETRRRKTTKKSLSGQVHLHLHLFFFVCASLSPSGSLADTHKCTSNKEEGNIYCCRPKNGAVFSSRSRSSSGTQVSEWVSEWHCFFSLPVVQWQVCVCDGKRLPHFLCGSRSWLFFSLSMDRHSKWEEVNLIRMKARAKKKKKRREERERKKSEKQKMSSKFSLRTTSKLQWDVYRVLRHI